LKKIGSYSKSDEVKEALQNRSQFLYLLGCYWWVMKKEGHVYRGITYSTRHSTKIYFVFRSFLENVDTILEAASLNGGGWKKYLFLTFETYRIRTKKRNGCHQITNLNKLTNKNILWIRMLY
jgi:hypothetical protein